MRKYFVLGLLLLTAGAALAQEGEFPKVETSPAFMYIRSNPNFTNAFTIQQPIAGGGTTPTAISGTNDFNCAGGGGTIAYNVSSLFGLAMDLGGCKIFGNKLGLGEKISGSQFTYLFGRGLPFERPAPSGHFSSSGSVGTAPRSSAKAARLVA